MVMDYDDSNRAFVQAFFARGVLTLDEAKPILAHIWSAHQGQEVSAADITQDDFNSMISAANNALSPLDYVIRSTRGQEDNERYNALVNTTSDELTQIATTHSKDEIGYVKRLLDELFDVQNTERREAMCITGKDALNLVKGRRRETQNQNGESQSNKFELSAHAVENLLSQLVGEGWLDKSRAGFYSLSPRALMELRHWLEETYNDEDSDYKKIKSCWACKEILTVGQRCAQNDCPVRLHNICTQAFFRTQSGNRTCPSCKTAWDGKHFVGEKAITTSESYLRGKRRSGARPAGNQDEAEDENEE